MIDNFSLGLAHVLMLYAAWRLLSRPDLDRDGDVNGNGNGPESQGWSNRP